MFAAITVLIMAQRKSEGAFENSYRGYRTLANYLFISYKDFF